MRHEDIAIALGISKPTLRKSYEAELAQGAAGKRMDVLNALYRAAKKGSSSAARIYLSTQPEVAAPPAENETPPAPELGKTRGKKEQANADAQTAQAGTGWEALLPAAKLQ